MNTLLGRRNFIQNWEQQFHMAVGAGYETRAGHGKVLQNDDEWRLWLSANKGFDRLHLGGVVNFFLVDGAAEGDGLGNSDHLSWHAHLDYYVNDWFSPVVEFSGYHVLNEGAELIPESGVDITNLGGGDDVVVIGLGAEARPWQTMSTRMAYETPITRNDDLFGHRWTFSMVFSF